MQLLDNCIDKSSSYLFHRCTPDSDTMYPNIVEELQEAHIMLAIHALAALIAQDNDPWKI